jgi:hypothetical protein
MRRLCVLLLSAILAACVVTPTPTVISPVSPLSPMPTPQPSSAIVPRLPVATIAASAALPTALQNADFEGAFTVRGNAITVAQYWNPWWLNAPYCRPGSVGCEIPCPKNCVTCPAKDQGCYWAMPEFAAAYRPDYQPPRAHSGQWAQKYFVYGRQGQGGLYQQVYVTTTSVLTFSAWLEAWQCFDADHCSLRAVAGGGSPTDPPADPTRAAFLMAQWGCTDKHICNDWTASDRPYKMHMRVGIDPTGGISPTAASVIWGGEIESFDYWSQAVVTATTNGAGVVTVFTSGAPTFDFARLNNDVYMDDAALEVVALAPPQVYRVYLPKVRR